MVAYLVVQRAFGENEAVVLSKWFLEPKTRMKPNLEYGQAVHGINTGRGTGLIDTVSMIHAAQGIWLLEQAGMLDRVLGEGVRKWYAAFLQWMTTSKKGLADNKSANNHAPSSTAHAPPYATPTPHTTPHQ